MFLQGREDVVLQRGPFLSPEREAGCTGGRGPACHEDPLTGREWGAVAAPDCDPHPSDSLSPPTALARCTGSLFGNHPEFTDVQATCVA